MKHNLTKEQLERMHSDCEALRKEVIQMIMRNPDTESSSFSAIFFWSAAMVFWGRGSSYDEFCKDARWAIGELKGIWNLAKGDDA